MAINYYQDDEVTYDHTDVAEVWQGDGWHLDQLEDGKWAYCVGSSYPRIVSGLELHHLKELSKIYEEDNFYQSTMR